MNINILSKYLFFLTALFLAGIYAFSIGPVIFMGDSLLFAERAKNIALNGNFNLNGGSFIYPPLYAMFMSIGYLFTEPEMTHKVILFTNVFLYSLAFFPIRNILIFYAQVKEKYSSILSLILTLSPFMLPYVSMFLSEALYFPILMWFAYYWIKVLIERDKPSFLFTGFFLGLALLVRTASNTVLIALVLIALLDLAINWRQDRKIFLKYALLLLSFIFTLGFWKVYETFFVVYKNVGAGYISIDIIKSIFRNKAEMDHHFLWLLNCIKYYFTSPLTASTLFAFSLLIFRPSLFKKDLFISFSFITSIGAACSIVLLTESSWGGTTLTWNRYLAPYVIFFVFVSLRYIDSMNNYSMRIIILVSFFLFLSNAPYNLGCHFPDSLIAFMDTLSQWNFIPLVKTYFVFRPPAFISNFVFYSLVLIPIFLFVFLKGFKRKVIPIVIVSIIYFFANYSSFKYWNNTGDLQLKNYKNGIGHALVKEYKKDKNIKVFIDPSLGKYFFQYLRISFYVPFEIKAVDINAIEKSQNNSFYYITDKYLLNQESLQEENLGIHLYRINDFSKNEILIYSLESGVGNQEDSDYLGEKIKVRWLERSSFFKIYSFTEGKEIKLKLQITSYPLPRNLTLKINGKFNSGKDIIRNIFGKDSFQNVFYTIKLKQGENMIEVLTDSESVELPGGRKVAFLLLNNPQIITEK